MNFKSVDFARYSQPGFFDENCTMKPVNLGDNLDKW
jgi:hypothetical protein